MDETIQDKIIELCKERKSNGEENIYLPISAYIRENYNEYVDSEYIRGVSRSYRKKYNLDKWFKPKTPQEDIKLKDLEDYNEFDLKRIEFEKERLRFFDQRTAYNKNIREASRNDELKDIIKSEIKNIIPYEYKPIKDIQVSNNDLYVSLNDLHFSADIDNFWNTYNPEVAKERLEEYLSQILSIKKLHNSQNCYVCANGDLISGNIHITIQVANRENAVK